MKLRFTPALAYPALALTALIWACNALIGRALHETVAPAVLGFWRWVVALIVLFPFVAAELRRRAADIRRAWRIMLLLGLLSAGVYNTLIYEALRYTTATNASLLNSSIPLWTVLAAWLIGRERTTRAQAFSLAISFVGVFVIISRGELSTLLQLRLNHGDALMLLGMMMWGIYSVCLRWRPAGLSAFAYLWVTGAIGLVLLLPWFGLSVAGGADPWPPASVWLAIAYLVILHSIAATAMFTHSVDAIGAARASHVVHLVPVFGVVLAAVLLDEPLRAYHLVGFVLILGGLGLAAFVSRHPAPAAARALR